MGAIIASGAKDDGPGHSWDEDPAAHSHSDSEQNKSYAVHSLVASTSYSRCLDYSCMFICLYVVCFNSGILQNIVRKLLGARLLDTAYDIWSLPHHRNPFYHMCVSRSFMEPPRVPWARLRIPPIGLFCLCVLVMPVSLQLTRAASLHGF